MLDQHSHKYQERTGRTLAGDSQDYNVKINLSPDEKLSVELQHSKYNTSYLALIKPEDIQKQSTKNGIKNVIESGTELFMIVEDCLKEGRIPFHKVVEITKNHQVVLHLELKLDFRLGIKRKNIVYQFATTPVPKPEDNNSNRLVQNELNLKLKKVQQENQNIKHQLNQIKQLLLSKEQSQLYLLDQFQLTPNSIFLYGNTAISTSRGINYLFLKKNIDPLKELNFKFRVATNSLIYFCLFKYDQLEPNRQPTKYAQLQTWIHCKGGEIVTVRLTQYKYDIFIEKNEIEQVSLQKKDEEEESVPNFAYSKTKKSSEFKKLINFQHLHLGIGLEFGSKIEMISMEEEK